MKQIHDGAKSDKVKIHIIITLAVMAFIFLHSAMTGDVSGGESIYFAKILASITGLGFQMAHFVVRKVAHFTEFTVLGVCLAENCNDYKSHNELIKAEKDPAKKDLPRHPLLAAWIVGTLYAGTDEFHQLFVTGRSCEFRDACIDSAGVAFGIVIFAIARFIRPYGYEALPSARLKDLPADDEM